MTDPRVEKLVARLEKGRLKTNEIFSALTPEQWRMPLYDDPPWQVRNLLAHFLSSEKQLFTLFKSVADGGPGAPPDLDIDRFNAAEQKRLEGESPQDLLQELDRARQETIACVCTLDAVQLARLGRHPALGEITVEAMIEAIYGHQLLHMRDLARRFQGVV
jgi:hypothetical protein